MPTYVYRFIDTGETIEVRQSFDDAALTEAPHPSDGQLRPVKKVFTPVGVTFKGSGFYKTDSSAGVGKSGGTAANADGATEKKADTAKADGGTSDGAKSDGAKSESTKPGSGAASTSNGGATPAGGASPNP